MREKKLDGNRAPGTLLENLAARVRTAYDLDRKQNPGRFLADADGLGRDYLFAENVARMLGCSLDFVRRIPRHRLPVSKIGQRAIYSKADVQAFILSERAVATRPMKDDNWSRPVQRVAKIGSRSLGRPKSIDVFDPVLHVQRLLGKGRRDG
ncbi:MAG: helix-turn-helix domain-containing protein [Mesorhizobium sp.]|nr:MAG: helix-turn-helix domain-containing protein [Mesorhizobium sp.]